MKGWSVRKLLLLIVAANLLLGIALFGLRSPSRVATHESKPRPDLPGQMR